MSKQQDRVEPGFWWARRRYRDGTVDPYTQPVEALASGRVVSLGTEDETKQENWLFVARAEPPGPPPPPPNRDIRANDTESVKDALGAVAAALGIDIDELAIL